MTKQKVLESMLRSAFMYAKNARQKSINDPENNLVEDKCCALSYAATCASKYTAAQALYYSNSELECEWIESLFFHFEDYVDEIMNDYYKGGNKQWVDIKFLDLEEAYQKFMPNT